MKIDKKTLSYVFFVLLLVTLPASVCLADKNIPYEGLMLKYDLNLPILTISPPSSFIGTAKFTFVNVTSTSTDIQVLLDGTLKVDGRSNDLKLNQIVNSPIGVNTLLYLTSDYDPKKDKIIEIVSIPLTINGARISLGGTFLYEGDLPINTHVGTFNTFRLKNQTTMSTLNIETYLHYEKDNRFLVYAEIKAHSALLSYSYTMKLSETNLSTNKGEVPTSNCLIATAAFGSPMHPQVQKLRSFRDNVVMETDVGSAFMFVFNQWYYSFSPPIAEIERESYLLQSSMQGILYPLIGVLKLSANIYDNLPFTNKMNLLVVGIFTSSTIGVVYLSPLFTLIFFQSDYTKKIGKKASLLLLTILAMSILTVFFLQQTSFYVLSGLTSIIVISSLLLGSIGTAVFNVRALTWLRNNF